jgi:hypothetical protein
VRARQRDQEGLNVTQYIENEIAERYATKFGRPFLSVHGYHKPFDVVSLSGDIAIEVKLDTKSATTGNFAIEYWCKGEASGIEATTADRFVLVVPRRKGEVLCYEIDTLTLKDTLRTRYMVQGGDGNRSMMKLLPVGFLPQLASDVFELKLDPSTIQLYWEQPPSGSGKFAYPKRIG